MICSMLQFLRKCLRHFSPPKLNWPWLRCTSWKSAIRLYSTNGRCGSNALNMKPRSPSDAIRKLIRPSGWSPLLWSAAGTKRCFA